MPITDNLNARELARILRIAGMAALRKGVLTTRQQNATDRIIDAANKRAAKGTK